MSIHSVENQFQQLTEPAAGKTAAVGLLGREAAFAQLLAAAGKDAATRPADSASLTTRIELLRLRMMRDALTLDSNPQNSDSSFPESVSANLVRALSSYRDAGATLPQDSPETSEQVVSTTENPPENPSFPVAGRLPASSVAPEVETTAVPRTIDEIIAKAARRFNVEPGLIKAVIKAESNFNPGAVSPVGARGLMQLMPGTARDLGVTDSFNPEQNVMAGTRYLRQMLDRYDGNLESALAAYNWGPGNVDKRGSFLPRETREYLVKIKSYYSDFAA
ncbi:MAG: lytic transglycosylase domain-containing protein [Geobacteraceae bacterium]